MLSFIKGCVAFVDTQSAVIECRDIGYEVFASARCLNELSVGSDVKIYTLLLVREDNITLYGFKDLSEKEMFSRLITVSGVGTKLAMALLSGIDSRSLASCIATQNSAMLNGIKGVGKKTAERILLELKGKISVDVSMATNGAESSPVSDDAVLALMALGYASTEAAVAISKVENRDKLSVEEIVMAALRG